ncbi:uncharacterized protein HRG_02416 [Hirsutella rhossiliensis]|uniref:Uncharacterized protein n=1 Tax=Hirsutella rhossiliensis TaxID=111463 RepID=A0A9P8N4W2_9HYPO|nr:uncharacterized protein HRG_02416 [Hirsutella rhossiliensis]KAH0967007.1 hypothetical protein HRG_02416 [Hirsutella rhossiliensis]
MSKTMAPSQLEDATHHDGSQGRSRIPGCSKPKGPKAWSMTRSMIAAFNSMRGSGNIADSNLNGPDQDEAVVWTEQYEVSDGEGEPEDGRISPCTFRLWATEVSDGQRRAEEANVNPRPYVHAQSARSTSPGSEGEEAEDFCPPLDPWAAFRIALWQYQVEVTNGRRECPGRRQSGAEGQELDSDDDDLLDGPGQVEAIRAALARHDAPTHFDGVPTDAIDEELRLRYQRAKDATYSVTRAVQEKWAAQERIALRSAQVQSVATAIGVIQQQQAQQQARQRERRQRRRRREEIYRHVEEHLRDVAAKADEAEYHASRHWAELDHLLAMEDHVCATLQQMALTVGLDDAVDPDEIEARVVEMGQQAEADAVADMSGDEEDWM